jgi:cytoskeleton protein RodZ
MRLEDLPSRPFTIGYVRAYAGLLGLDGEAAVTRFKNDSPDENGELRAPVGVRRERDPRLALIFAGGLLVVGAILLWNVAQRAITKVEPPPQVASAAASTQVQAHASNNQVALGAPLPAPVESTTPEPYKTPGLDDAAANGGSVDAAHAAAKTRAEADAKAGVVDPSTQFVLGGLFKPKGAVLGATPPRPRASSCRPARPRPWWCAAATARSISPAPWRPASRTARPRTPGLTAGRLRAGLFEVYAGGVLTGRLQSNQTALSKLVPAAWPAPKP